MTFDASGVKLRWMWELFNLVRTGPERAIVCCSSGIPSGLVYGWKAGEVRARAPKGIALTAAAHAGSLCRLACFRLCLCFAVP